mmetsp:Transcript_27028/g.49105  ORF Transcript_27028/g.49105 Transcript_27028/m.49105 type:complete len:245 (+) Transcript_27028:968-1702(+)
MSGRMQKRRRVPHHRHGQQESFQRPIRPFSNEDPRPFGQLLCEEPHHIFRCRISAVLLRVFCLMQSIHLYRQWQKLFNFIRSQKSNHKKPPVMSPEAYQFTPRQMARGWKSERGLCALGIFHRLGVHDNVLILAHERWHHDFHAVVQNSWLKRIRGGLTFHNRLGFHNLAGYFLWQACVQSLGLVEFHNNGHAILQERATITQQIRRNLILLIALGVHKDQHSVVFIQELLILLLKTNALDLIG